MRGSRVYMCMCVCAGTVNWTVSRASVREALVHTNRRAVKMSVCVLTLWTVIGRSREETGNAARSEMLLFKNIANINFIN